MVENDLSIIPEKFGYIPHKYLECNSNRLKGYSIGSTKGTVLLVVGKNVCSCPKHKIEDIIIHETLHHVVREVAGEKAFWELDNLCYEKKDVCSISSGLGYGLTLEKYCRK